MNEWPHSPARTHGLIQAVKRVVSKEKQTELPAENTMSRTLCDQHDEEHGDQEVTENNQHSSPVILRANPFRGPQLSPQSIIKIIKGTLKGVFIKGIPSGSTKNNKCKCRTLVVRHERSKSNNVLFLNIHANAAAFNWKHR